MKQVKGDIPTRSPLAFRMVGFFSRKPFCPAGRAIERLVGPSFLNTPLSRFGRDV